ncbi:hypothetical protein B484DRAFT_389541, partial [Ochromonadaceae sp. CCMP2298]
MMMTNFLLHPTDVYTNNSSTIALVHASLLLMLVEAVLKICFRGFRSYARSFRNQVDLGITLGCVSAGIGAALYESEYDVNGFTIMVRVLLLFRVILFPRNLRFFFVNHSLKRFARLMRRICAKTLTLGIVFLCLGYFFATLGQFLFGGLIDKSPTGPHYDALTSSRYAVAGYWGLNFNDFMSSCITLFCCLHVSDFDLITT